MSATSVRAGQAAIFAGTVAPARAGYPVYLERRSLDGLSWRRVDTTSVAADGSYSITHVFSANASGNYSVQVPADREFAAVDSQPFAIAVFRPLLGAPASGEGEAASAAP